MYMREEDKPEVSATTIPQPKSIHTKTFPSQTLNLNQILIETDYYQIIRQNPGSYLAVAFIRSSLNKIKINT